MSGALARQCEVTCPSLKWGKITWAVSERLAGVLQPGEGEKSWAVQLGEPGLACCGCPQLNDCAFSLALQPQPSSLQKRRAQENSQAGYKGHAGVSQESVAGRAAPRARLSLSCGCGAFCSSRSPSVYQHLMAAPKGASPGRTSKSIVCIQG